MHAKCDANNNDNTSANSNNNNNNNNSSKKKSGKSGKKAPPKPMHEVTQSTRSMDISTASESARGAKVSQPHHKQQQGPPPPPGLSPRPPKPPSKASVYDATKRSDPNYGANQTITILHVAEKPSIASSVAKALASRGAGNYNDYKGIGTPVHEFTAVHPQFTYAPKASKTLHKVTSVTGHVYNVDFGEKYQSWDSVDPQELYSAPIVRKPCKGSIVKHLSTVGKGADFVVLWMDCDREGENINFEVLGIVMPVMKNGGNNNKTFERVYRAHFSAISEGDILKAYEKLGKPDQHQSQAVDARQELDLKIGVR